MNYYFAGYFLIKPNLINSKLSKNKYIFTCSSCINTSLLSYFSRSWTSDNKIIIDAQDKYDLSNTIIKKIHKWTDEKDKSNDISYREIFNNLNAAKEFREQFFCHLKDVYILGLYFPEIECNRLIIEFAQQDHDTIDFGIINNLKKKLQETEDGRSIGFDYIGIEVGGDFHSYKCNNLEEKLHKKFNIEINNHGLIKDDKNWNKVINYLNDDETGCEPVPWYLTKVKIFD